MRGTIRRLEYDTILKKLVGIIVGPDKEEYFCGDVPLNISAGDTVEFDGREDGMHTYCRIAKIKQGDLL